MGYIPEVQNQDMPRSLTGPWLSTELQDRKSRSTTEIKRRCGPKRGSDVYQGGQLEAATVSFVEILCNANQMNQLIT